MENRQGSHRIYSLQVLIVWITKYRYPVLQGEITNTLSRYYTLGMLQHGNSDFKRSIE
jgi:REP element-mobilizing transposase RayT